MSQISNKTNGRPKCQNPGKGIDFNHFLDCVHCGLCTSSCPTYTELGDENDGPRGRIHLMRAVTEGRINVDHRIERHLKLCLDCRACETACPSGVKYGRLIEPFRLAVEESNLSLWKRFDPFRAIVLFQLFPYAKRLRFVLAPVKIAQRLGLYGLAERMGLLKLIPGRMGQMVTLLPPPVKSGRKLPKFLPSIGRRRARVAFFVGCVADAMFRHTHWATLRVLQQNGCDIVIPDRQGCCGAIRYHAADSDGARKEADVNVATFDLKDIDAIVVNHAGCGAMMKEYGLHWKDANTPNRQAFADKVKDINEFLDELGLIPPSGRIETVATYHDACHLAHAQKIVNPPRRLLNQIPGIELRELPEADFCCGSAGTYNLNEAKMAKKLGHRKFDNIVETGAKLILTSNAGCLLQIGRELRKSRQPLMLMHPMDLLDLSYRNEQPKFPK